jgi:multicomponent Na+:H+ antiporter subunit A
MLLSALVGAGLAPIASARLVAIGGLLAALLPLALFVYFFQLVDAVGTAPLVETVAWIPSLGIDLVWRLDGFSLLFALLITGIGTGVTLYAATYFDKKTPFARGQFILYIQLFMVAMLATVLADNLLVLFVFWELTSLLSFLLVGFDSTNPIARRAALQSLLVTVAGGLALFAGILLIGIVGGTFSLSALLADSTALTESSLLPVIIGLVLLGAFTKSAQAPFHFWLPNAMAAPTPASAYLHSATMVKLGVYLLARFDPLFSTLPWFGPLLVAVGGLTMLLAAVQALRAVEFKAVLAFSTVAALGTIVMLIGLDGEVAAVATVGFILAHALYKATLFFCAGIVIHSTGVTRLQRLGGLARALPLTALATVLAAFSMAGLPPFLGFISKEYLFEAKLDSSFTVVAVGLGVLVNAVMVAVATVIVLRPFFTRPPRPIRVQHGETIGLTLPPLVLGLTGVSLGFAPWLVAEPLIQPAASVIHGSPIAVSFKLWHGLTPMLALSALVVVLGGLLAWFWDPIHVALRRRRELDEVLLDKGYDNVLRWTLDLAGRCTATLQNGDMRHYAAITAAAVTGLMVYGLLSTGGALWPVLDQEPLRPYLVIVAALIVTGALVAAKARSLVTAVVGVGLAGYGLAMIFLLNGGPDLALTQFAVETLFVVIVVAVLLRLPISAASTRSRGEKLTDFGLASAFAAAVATATLWITAGPLDRTLAGYFAETSYTEAFGRNVVNVILVDFRALDTFGEIAVVAFAALAAWTLLRPAGRRRRTGTSPLAIADQSQGNR